MNARERILAAIGGNAQDRTPWTFVSSAFGAKLAKTEMAAHYSDPKAYARGQDEVAERFDPDILFAPFALSLEAAAYGCPLAPQKNAAPNVKKPAFRSVADAKGLKPIAPDSDPGLSFLVEASRLVSSRHGTDRHVAAVVVAPTDFPALLLGIEAWIETLLFDREMTRELLGFSRSHFIALANAYFDAGVSFVACPVMFANPCASGERLVRDILLPALAEAFSSVRGKVVFHHAGQTVGKWLNLYRGMTNVIGFALGQPDELPDARLILGDGPLLLGSLYGPLLSGLSPERAAGTARAIASGMRGDGRWVFSTAGADVPWDTDPDVILAVRDAVISGGI